MSHRKDTKGQQLFNNSKNISKEDKLSKEKERHTEMEELVEKISSVLKTMKTPKQHPEKSLTEEFLKLKQQFEQKGKLYYAEIADSMRFENRK